MPTRKDRFYKHFVILFLFLFVSCEMLKSKEKIFKDKEKALLENICKDNNLPTENVLFSNNTLYIDKDMETVKLSAYSKVKEHPYPSLFFYHGPQFDFKEILSNLQSIEYIKIYNTSMLCIDYSILSGINNIKYICISNAKYKELYSFSENNIPTVAIYGSQCFDFPLSHFYKAFKNVETLAIANVFISDDGHKNTNFSKLTSLRCITTYQDNLIKNNLLPHLRQLDLYHMSIDLMVVNKLIHHCPKNTSITICSSQIDSYKLINELQRHFDSVNIIMSYVKLDSGKMQYIDEYNF